MKLNTLFLDLNSLRDVLWSTVKYYKCCHHIRSSCKYWSAITHNQILYSSCPLPSTLSSACITTIFIYPCNVHHILFRSNTAWAAPALRLSFANSSKSTSHGHEEGKYKQALRSIAWIDHEKEGAEDDSKILKSEGKAFSLSRVVDMNEDKVKKIQTISPGWCGSGYVRKASHWKPHWQPLNPPLDSNQKRAFAPKVQFDQHCDQPKSFCVLCECAWMLCCAFWWGC